MHLIRPAIAVLVAALFFRLVERTYQRRRVSRSRNVRHRSKPIRPHDELRLTNL
ncbi:MAG: hypothetical protein AAF293_01585 [Pseudomonadota bacterium]